MIGLRLVNRLCCNESGTLSKYGFCYYLSIIGKRQIEDKLIFTRKYPFAMYERIFLLYTFSMQYLEELSLQKQFDEEPKIWGIDLSEKSI
jgi:hypothetical protein